MDGLKPGHTNNKVQNRDQKISLNTQRDKVQKYSKVENTPFRTNIKSTLSQ